MIFKVTHIDQAGHRHHALVIALHAEDACDQMERQFGEPRLMSYKRVCARPVLHVVRTTQQANQRGAQCTA